MTAHREQIHTMTETLISLDLEHLESGDWLATSDDMPGLVAQGRTIAETLEIAQDVARKLVESYLEHGDALPPALSRAVPQRTVALVPVGAV